jgi:hypothetical protein
MTYCGRIVIVAGVVVATVAAQVVCGCPYVTKAVRPRLSSQERSAACSGSSKCCRKAATSAAPMPEPAKRGPCERCNFVHRPDGLQPERHSTADTVLHPYLVLSPLPPPDPFILTASAALPRPRERIPIPRLLQDLFHTGMLLLV